MLVIPISSIFYPIKLNQNTGSNRNVELGTYVTGK